jgi:hypothetical protein
MPYNDTKKGKPLRRHKERAPKNSALKGLETDEPGDASDYRDGKPFKRFQNVCLAFLRSQWEQGLDVSMGTFGRAFGFHTQIYDAVVMLTAERAITVIERGPRSFITAGPGMPVDEPQPRYGDVFQRVQIRGIADIGTNVAYSPTPWDRLTGPFRRQESEI